jgi:hypothetical protein
MRSTATARRLAREVREPRDLGPSPILSPPPRREEPCADCGTQRPVTGLRLRPDPTGAARNRRVCSACAL